MKAPGVALAALLLLAGTVLAHEAEVNPAGRKLQQTAGEYAPGSISIVSAPLAERLGAGAYKGRKLQQTSGDYAPSSILILGAPLVERLAPGIYQGRRLRQVQGPVAPTAAAILGAPLAEELLAGPTGSTGRKLMQGAGSSILQAAERANLLSPPAAESLTGPYGNLRNGRKLQQAGLSSLLPAPVAENLVQSATLAGPYGSGRKLQQAGTEYQGLPVYGPIPVPELPTSTMYAEQPTTGRRLAESEDSNSRHLNQIVDTSALLPLLIIPVAERPSSAGEGRQGRRLEQASDVLGSENIVGRLGIAPQAERSEYGGGSGRRLQQSPITGLETSTARLLPAPLAERGSYGALGRRLQAEAYEVAPLIPAAEERIRQQVVGGFEKPASPTGRKLQQGGPDIQSFLARFAPEAERREYGNTGRRLQGGAKYEAVPYVPATERLQQQPENFQVYPQQLAPQEVRPGGRKLQQTILTGRFAPLAELERKEYGPVGRRLLQDENYQTVPISPATERVLQAQLEAPKPRP